MSTAGFPLPFRGIKLQIEVPYERLPEALVVLAECEHAHNFAVEMDREPPAIWTSELGARDLFSFVS